MERQESGVRSQESEVRGTADRGQEIPMASPERTLAGKDMGLGEMEVWYEAVLGRIVVER